MSGFLIASGHELYSSNERLLRSMYRLRDNVFRVRLGWSVTSFGGMEVDGFDGLDPTYVLYTPDNEEVTGCWRILPTTGPYMLSEVFPELLRGEAMPSASDVWELSRFAVSAKAAGASRIVNPTTLGMMQKAVEFACERGIRSYVTVTTAAMERLLVQLGLCIRRFGDGKTTQLGKVRSLACWIDMNEQTKMAIEKAYQITQWEKAA